MLKRSKFRIIENLDFETIYLKDHHQTLYPQYCFYDSYYQVNSRNGVWFSVSKREHFKEKT